jgi:hypothetical protein
MFTVRWWDILNVNCLTWWNILAQVSGSLTSVEFTARTGKVRLHDTRDSVTKSDVHYKTTVLKKVLCEVGGG